MSRKAGLVAVLAMVFLYGIGPGLSAPIADEYKRLTDTRGQLKAQAAPLQTQKGDLDGLRKDMILRMKDNDKQRKSVNNISRPTPDVSLYRCPISGVDWYECTHGDLKDKWYQDQLDRMTPNFQRQMDRLLEDLQKRQASTQEDLDKYFRKLNDFERDRKDLSKDADKFGKDLSDFAKAVADANRGKFTRDNLEAAAKLMQKDKDKYAADGDVTQCSLYGRDFAARLAGRSLPELAGQAKDQYKQLDASPNFQKLVVKTDTAKAFQDAQKAANDGKLVLYVTPDHIQVGVPATQMPMSGAWGMAVPVVSQAGTGLSASQAKRLKLTEGESVHEHIPLSDGFTTSAKDEMKIFIYDPK